MSNIELYSKVNRVVMSCTNADQLKIAENYVRLAQKVLNHEWCLEAIHLLLAKEKELLSR